MGIVIYSMGVSLDGFMESPGREIGWSAPDDEVHRFANEQAAATSGSVYGRHLYEVMAGYWPSVPDNPDAPAVEREFAATWLTTPRLVFSRTLSSVDWNSRLATEDITTEVRRFQEETGGDLDCGGAGLAAQLIRLGLVDEFRLLVYPVVLGAGRPFFPLLDAAIKVEQVETRRFDDSGVVYLRYRKVA
ncbi:MAG: dihydrofolate reductase [Geodermatophilaceae bacterium]|nr:dihydrofolate reductase [Geodermatophilaceae bacterium]